MKKILIIILPLLIVSCSPKDKQFCECLKISNELTEASQAALKNDHSENVVKKIDSLSKVKRKQCADYEMLDGETLLKKRNDCGWTE